MLPVFDRRPGFSRRELLRIGTLGLGGLALPHLLGASGRLGPLVLAGGGLPMGQVIGRSTRDGGEAADNPVHMRHLIGTIFHTLFDVAELRLGPDATGLVAKVITVSEPIRELIA